MTDTIPLRPIDPAHDLGDWHARAGSWRPIETADKAHRLDLWVQTFEQCGVLVKDCWWNADAPIPDWYRDGEAGPELAAAPHAYVSHWKLPSEPHGPIDDGGPGLLARTYLDDEGGWPAEMLERAAAYRAAREDGQPPAPDFDPADDCIPW